MAKKKKKKKSGRLIYKVILFLIIAGAFLFFFTKEKLKETLPIEKSISLTIPIEASIGDVIDSLNNKGVFEPGLLFNISARIYSLYFKQELHPGTYRFSKDNSNIHLIRSIFSGKKLNIVRVTFHEGINLWKYASIASDKIGIDSSVFMKIAKNDSLKKVWGIKSPSVEGYLKPDTYRFFRNEKPEKVINKLLYYQDKLWKDNFEDLAAAAGMSRNEVLTMASIVQAEAAVNEEMPKIAGVYYNRLKKGWKLEADPTVQYAIGSKSRLRRSDLNNNSPYNTYRFKGLPPGPINSPGKEAIAAALNPESHGFMFFVARGDGSGLHYFAKTNAEHNANRIKYKKNKESN